MRRFSGWLWRERRARPGHNTFGLRALLVYVHYLEAAPWNLRELTPDPHFGGVGQVLLVEAMRLSLKRGWSGRIGLHSLPQAVPFYRDTVGMSELGLDAVEGLPYFETTPTQASAYLVR